MEITVTEKQTFTLTNDCVCTKFDEETGEEMVDENGDPIPSDYCHECYEEELDVFNDFILDEWLARNNADRDSRIVVSTEAMNWNKVAGYASVSAKDLVDTLSINSSWILRFTLDEQLLTVVRSSHDELGSFFIVSFEPEETENSDRNDWATVEGALLGD
jgi:hypothetical protein